MNLSIYQVDAFTDKLFTGNPAAVCPLEGWLDDHLLQQIAAENNLAETAYFVRTDEGFHIRWFTPKAEVDLCGHATLGTAFVLFEILAHPGSVINFQSRSGLLTVTKKEDWFTLNFPADRIEPIGITDQLNACFNRVPLEAYNGTADYLLVFRNQEEIAELVPDFNQIMQFNKRGIIVTARGSACDFVSRYFAPAFGINEDPVTGSAHTTLMPYWSKVMGKQSLTARQISERGGLLKCKMNGDRVEISGQAVLYLKGQIEV